MNSKFKLVHEEENVLDIEQRKVLVDGNPVPSVFINQIANYYGTLVCFQVDGKYCMGIEDYGGKDTAVCIPDQLAMLLAELSVLPADSESVEFKTEGDWVDKDE